MVNRGATEGLKMVGEYFPWAFHANHTAAQHTSAQQCDTDDSASSVLRTISGASSMSTGSELDPSTPPSQFIYTQANHKSVLGIGAYAKQHGAQLHCLTMEQMQSWLCSPPGSAVPESYHNVSSQNSHPACTNGLCGGPRQVPSSNPANSTVKSAAAGTGGGCCPVPRAAAGAAAACAPVPVTAAAGAGAVGSSCCGAGVTHHLVAYPAKDNYEGRIYPLEWIEQVPSNRPEGCTRCMNLRTTLSAALHGHAPSTVNTPDACVHSVC